ncbi:hypothetical protein [Ruegeria arenilitoris]|uniref:hypothetical protein n=1 Tax=Ruegeria arenilitoris TaxID=1173585 RepID=UPI00147B8C2E
MTAPTDFLDAFFALPAGSFIGTANGRSYSVTRLAMAGGKSHKLVAHERGGADYISMNLYLTDQSGALLRPCEMPAAKVVCFVLALAPDS